MGTTANITDGRNPRATEAPGHAFAGLRELERTTGVPAANLLAVLETESSFHPRILSEKDAERRRVLYRELYAAVHPLLAVEQTDSKCYERLAKLLTPEVRNKSTLDLGCGDGSLLRAIARHGSPADLAGVDIYPFRQQLDDSFKFFQGDVINFKIWPAVEVVISSQVVEHLAPADLGEHIRSVRQSLVENGTFVLMTPNRLWGPHDITRACDFTNSNRIPARGSHLNELTYRELITVLGTHGFTDLRTVFPFAHRLPGLSRIRIRPTINLLIEQSAFLRKLSYLIAWNGRAIYKNPIVLVARKA